jgi:hypothetical protein
MRPERVYIFASFHQSPPPLALICRAAGVPWVGAICDDYPGTLLDLHHHVEDGIPEPERTLSLARAAGCEPPKGDDGALRYTPAAARPRGRMPRRGTVSGLPSGCGRASPAAERRSQRRDGGRVGRGRSPGQSAHL